MSAAARRNPPGAWGRRLFGLGLPDGGGGQRRPGRPPGGEGRGLDFSLRVEASSC
jgi:hypothetical protein